MKLNWKIIVPILFALAALLGIIQRKNLPDFSFGSKTSITHFSEPSADSLEGYYQKSQELSGKQNQRQTVSFNAFGDIMLSRNVALSIKQANDANLPFEKMADVLKSANFNFANLESPVAPDKAIVGGHTMIFGADPDYLAGLKTYNFQILNLANNHAFDQGLAGLDATKKALDNLGLSHVGTGNNLDQAWAPVVVNSNGLKICFAGASYASVNDGGQTQNNYVARMQDLPRLKSVILKLKSSCDFIVASMHGGIEYTRTPNDLQTSFARAAIDYGADIVIGAHPHWVQTIERYCPNSASTLPSPLVGEGAPKRKLGADEGLKCQSPKYIFYSLGNFIFDQNFSQDTKEGLTLKIVISKSVASNPQTPGAASLSDLQGGRTPAKLESIELLPIIIDNSQPRPATAEETKKILDKIGQTSSVLYP